MKTEELQTIISQIVKEQIEAVRARGVQQDDPIIRHGTEPIMGNMIAANISGNLVTTKQGSVLDMSNRQNPWQSLSSGMENFSKAIRELIGNHQTKLLQENTDPAGGYLVPEEFEAVMVQVDPVESCLWPRVTIWPMGTDSLSMPKLEQRMDHSASDYNPFAGIEWVWTQEGQSKEETEPDFSMLELIAHELSGYTEVTNILLEDSPLNLLNIFTGIFRKSWQWVTDRGFFRGNGARQMLGIIQDPSVLSVPRQTAGAVTYQDILNMDSKLNSCFDPNAHWFGSKAVYNSLRGQVDANGHPVLQQHYMPGPGGVGMRQVEFLLGYPAIRSCEKTMPLGQRGDLVLCDPALYYVGLRKGFSMDISKHFRFRQNRTALRVTGRLDGLCSIPEGFVLLDTVSVSS